MLIPVHLRSFERDLEKSKKRGLDTEKLKAVIQDLITEKPLAEKHKKSQAKGKFRWVLGMSSYTRLAARLQKGQNAHLFCADWNTF